MDRNKLFKINFIIQAILTTVSQIINIVQQKKTKTKTKTKTKDESERTDSEGWKVYDNPLHRNGSVIFFGSGNFRLSNFLEYGTE